ncbi:hypothetical protein MTR_7g101000 [Medicago truncatula]|uniref:Uncharacterized protein n=1 Tax=Medicago truncatula TaxID=3880 RepID=G7L2R1_MEDTR|nr:hypothetical protein MTR_7g101000 [Medicago truncatula]
MWELGHLLSGFRYRTTHHLCPRTKPNSAGREGCVKSPTSDRTWLDNVFIRRDNLHLTNRFCGIVLDPTTISKRRKSWLGTNLTPQFWAHTQKQ